MTDVRKVYWDSNAWLGLINREPDKVRALEYVYQAARRGEIEIWTSVIAYAEVYKMKDDPSAPRPLDEQNRIIEEVLAQDFVKLIEVNALIGIAARDLLRKHSELKKPFDAVHLASAAYWNLDALHTYDNENLLRLNGQVLRRDGQPLQVCKPELDSDGPLLAHDPGKTDGT